MPAAVSRALQPDGRRADRDVPEERGRCSAGSPRSRRPSIVHRLVSGPAPGSDPGQRRELEVVERRDLARDAVDREQVGPVAGRLDEQHVLDERQHVAERRPGLGLGQQHDPGVVGAELDLVLGEDHPVRELAANLALLELQPAREHARRAARRPRSRPRRSSRRRRRSGAARPPPRRRGRAGAGRRSGACRPRARAPTRKRPRLPSSSGTPRRSMPSTSAVETESRVGELVERHLERDVLPQPGDRDSQNCLSTRRSPSQSGADVREVVLELRDALDPAAEGEARSTPRGRCRRSRTRAGRPCPAPPISSQPE